MAAPRNANGPAGGKRRSVTSDLASRIAKARGGRPGDGANGSGSDQDGQTGFARAARLGTEFVAAVLVGTALGYGLDVLLGTGPWLMLVMLLAGFGAGILNVVRAAAEMNATNPPPPDADLDPYGDDEEEDN